MESTVLSYAESAHEGRITVLAHHEDKKDTKKNHVPWENILPDILARSANMPSAHSFVNFRNFVVSLCADLGVIRPPAVLHIHSKANPFRYSVSGMDGIIG